MKEENTSIRHYFEENQQSSMNELITINEQFKS